MNNEHYRMKALLTLIVTSKLIGINIKRTWTLTTKGRSRAVDIGGLDLMEIEQLFFKQLLT